MTHADLKESCFESDFFDAKKHLRRVMDIKIYRKTMRLF